MRFEVLSLSEVKDSHAELRARGRWFALNIDRRMNWPTSAQQFRFEGHALWIIPITTDHHPGIATIDPQADADEVWAMLHRALSFIAWYQSSGSTVVARSHAGSFMMSPLADRTASIIGDSFDFSAFPSIDDPSARLAVALIREGRGMNHPAYSFLSFYRAIERAIPDGPARGQWISEAISRLTTHRAKEALAELRKSFDGDVGKHLYNSGRMAIAHARAEPVINPDDPRDANRLRRELPIIEELAVLASEEHLGIQTRHTLWRRHLYELAGWKPIFGPELIDLITSGGTPAPEQTLNLPSIHLRLRRSPAFAPLENLQPTGWSVHEGKGEVQYASADRRVSITLLLDFAAERLIFPLDVGIRFEDDGSADAAQVGKQLTMFVHDYNGNGELQIWNAEDGTQMSRCDAFIPTNVIFNPEGAKAELAHYDAEIVRRMLTASTS